MSLYNKEEIYKKWKSLVNMTKSELEKFYNSDEGKEAGLSSSEAKSLGIHNGRQSARWIMKMKDTPHDKWTPQMWEWANRQISFISRMKGGKGELYDDNGNKTRRHTSLLIWGHNPEKFEGGGILKTGSTTNLGIIEDETETQYKINGDWYAKSLVKAIKKEEADKPLYVYENAVAKLRKEYGSGFIKLYHGTDKESYDKIISSKTIGDGRGITFFTSSLREAREYAHNKSKYRGVVLGGKVLEVSVPKWAVHKNKATGEYETEFILKENEAGAFTPTMRSVYDVYKNQYGSGGKVGGQYLYHGTGEGAFRKIREEGLIPQGGKHLYFADKEQYAKTYAERKGNSFGNRILRIKKSDIFIPDENTGLKGDYKMKAAIPPQDIELKYKNEWIPIQEYSDENIGIMPVKFGDGGMIAPNGKKSNLTPEQYKLVRTPEFKAWFGDFENDPENSSKVVDENGEPLVVYHGTKKMFNDFEIQKNISNKYLLGNDNNIGFFFTNDINSAEKYAGIRIVDGEKKIPTNSRVIECFLNIRIPYNYDFSEYAMFTKQVNDGKLMREQIEALGYDGITIQNNYSIIAFEPEQIKLADGTNTTFDTNNPDIRYEVGGVVSEDIECNNCGEIFKISVNNNYICPKCHYDNETAYIMKALKPTKTLQEISLIHDVPVAELQLQLDKGIEEEKAEHTNNNVTIAKVIALHHIEEDPYYYIQLSPVEFGNGGSTDCGCGNNMKYEDGGNVDCGCKHSMERVGETLLAPNGKPSNLSSEQWHLVRTKEFESFFGDWLKLANAKISDSGIDDVTIECLSRDVSKVVDENDEPLVVWHSSSEDFNIFKNSKDGGFHFGAKEQAIIRSGRNLKPYFLSIKNIGRSIDRKDGQKILIIKAKDEGIDGFTYNNIFEGGGISYTAFYPNQIKLADGSNTTFDSSNNDIRYEEGGGIVKSGYDSIDEILEQAKPFQEEIVQKRIAKMKEDNENISPYEEDMIRFSLIFDLTKALSNYLNKEDKPYNVSFRKDKGVIIISANIERDSNKNNYIFTQMIIAGGHNIQVRHYRYIVDTNLPYKPNISALSNIDSKIKAIKKKKNNLDKIADLKREIEHFEKRIEKYKQSNLEIPKKSDEQILKESYLKDSLKDTYEKAKKRGAPIAEKGEQAYNDYYDNCKKEIIDRYKDGIRANNINIKMLEVEIKKCNAKIDKLNSENDTLGYGGLVGNYSDNYTVDIEGFNELEPYEENTTAEQKLNQLDKGVEIESAEHLETLHELEEGNIDTKEAIIEIAESHIDENPEYYDTSVSEYYKRTYHSGGSIKKYKLGGRLELSEIPSLVKTFMPVMEQKALVGSEEHWDILMELENCIKNMPKTYDTQRIPENDKIVYLHYFYGGSDWYIVEKDMYEDQRQAFGYVILNGDTQDAEWGYISIEELKSTNRVELDLYFTPIKFGELRQKWEIHKEPVKEVKVETENIQSNPQLDKIKKDFLFLVGLQRDKDNKTPNGWDINLFKSSFYNKINKLSTDDRKEMFDYMESTEERLKSKGQIFSSVFTKNHKIWDLKPKIEQSTEEVDSIDIFAGWYGSRWDVPPSDCINVAVILYQKGYDVSLDDNKQSINITKDGKTIYVNDNGGELNLGIENPQRHISNITYHSNNYGIVEPSVLAEKINEDFKEFFAERFNPKQHKILKEEVLLPNSEDEFNESVFEQIDPNDGWIGNEIKERAVKQQIYQIVNNATSDDIETLFNEYRDWYIKKYIEVDYSHVPYERIKQWVFNGGEFNINDYSEEDFRLFLKKTGFGYGKELTEEQIDRSILLTKYFYIVILKEVEDCTKNIHIGQTIEDFRNILKYEKDIHFECKQVSGNVHKMDFKKENTLPEYGTFAGSVDEQVSKDAYIPNMPVKVGGYTIEEINEHRTKNGKEPLVFEDPKKVLEVPSQSLVSNFSNNHKAEKNEIIRQLVAEKGIDRSLYSADELEFIKGYDGMGAEKKTSTDVRILDQFFTSVDICAKMWGLAIKYGFSFNGASILEPSFGSGRFFHFIPKNANCKVSGFDIDETCYKICKVLFPEFNLTLGSFESLFFKGNRNVGLSNVTEFYDLVIGNPPYREYVSTFAPLGEKKATLADTFEMYFIARGVDLLKKDGLLIYIIPNNFLSNDKKYNAFKEKLAQKCNLIDAYRLPNGVFGDTNVGTDIIVLRKK